jgi:uncharacterized protein (DUF1499 family)
MRNTMKDASPFALFCVAAALALALASIMPGLGVRLEWWHFRRGLALLKWTAYGELAIAAASLLGCIFAASRRSGRSFTMLAIALVISIGSVSVPVRMWMIARSVPAIHDITTDTENPPVFRAILRVRGDALNPAEYGGPDVAQKQRKAYSDINPLLLDDAPAKAFERALAAARAMRWDIVSAHLEQGLIEATDTTFWFGFKDDIVIRISPHDGGSRVDVRSVSRVGKSDLGANAERIRNFLKTLKQNRQRQ